MCLVSYEAYILKSASDASWSPHAQLESNRTSDSKVIDACFNLRVQSTTQKSGHAWTASFFSDWFYLDGAICLADSFEFTMCHCMRMPMVRLELATSASSLKFLCWYQEFLCSVEPLYFSDEKSPQLSNDKYL